MRFIWITHWSHGALLKKNVLFRSPQKKKLNRNDNEEVHGKCSLDCIANIAKYR